MKIGYVRVSTLEQNTARQDIMMREQEIEKVFTEKISGKSADRPQLHEMLNFIREGDCVIVESISRLARNTRDLLTIVEEIHKKGADFISEKETIDTRTPQGRFMLTVFGAMAELERDSILQRQAEGIAAAKAAGKYTGRQPIKIDDDAFRAECRRWKAGNQTARETMEKLGLKPNTFYRRVKELGL